MPNLFKTCPICKGHSVLFDVVDSNKSCVKVNGNFLKLSGIPVYYVLCESCHFCYAPSMYKWPMNEFENKIYNDAYIDVDPDCAEKRPLNNAQNLINLFGEYTQFIRHLDYGGGNGLLSQRLKEAAFDSTSYDPFVNKETRLHEIGKFDLITAFEVFEHVPDVHMLMSTLKSLLKPNGIIFFSTLLSDGHIIKNQRLTWWYASPRNGHISLFSQMSLAKIAQQYALNMGSFNSGTHLFWKTVPHWARQLIK